MKPSIKLAAIYAVVASLSIPNAFAQSSAKSDDWFDKPTISFTGGGSVDYATNGWEQTSDDFGTLRDIGKKVSLRNLHLSAEVEQRIVNRYLAVKATLEENQSTLKVDAEDSERLVREILLGIAIDAAGNYYVRIGKGDLSYGGNHSDYAQSEVNKLQQQLQGKNQIALTVDPRFAKQVLNTIVKIHSLEVSAFDSSTGLGNVNMSDKIDAATVRVIASLGKVLTQASYMRVDKAEWRASVSASRDFVPAVFGPMMGYTEVQVIRNSPTAGNVNLATIGLTKSLLPSLGNGSLAAFAEVTRTQQAGTSSNARNSAAIGASYDLSKFVSAKLAVQNYAYSPKAEISPVKDNTVVLSIDAKNMGRAELGKMATAKASPLTDAQAAKAAKIRAGK